jgi:hypothetical protein
MHLNLSQPGPAGAYNPLRALYPLLVPESGASFSTISGEARTIAQVFLAPGDGLSRRHRNLALAHPLVSFHVRGDWQRAPSPAAFHPITLRWGLYNSDNIAVWSAPFPQFADDVGEWGIAAANAGSRFTTIIETTIEQAAAWATVVRRWRRRSAALRFFGPESVEAVQ